MLYTADVMNNTRFYDFILPMGRIKWVRWELSQQKVDFYIRLAREFCVQDSLFNEILKRLKMGKKILKSKLPT